MTGAVSRSKSNKAKPPAAPPSPSVTDASFLGAPPLIPGEAASDYEQLLTAVTKVMNPVDFLEKIWTRDIVEFLCTFIRSSRESLKPRNSSFLGQDRVDNLMKAHS